jgi:hypothetical protein
MPAILAVFSAITVVTFAWMLIRRIRGEELNLLHMLLVSLASGSTLTVFVLTIAGAFGLQL